MKIVVENSIDSMKNALKAYQEELKIGNYKVDFELEEGSSDKGIDSFLDKYFDYAEAENCSEEYFFALALSHDELKDEILQTVEELITLARKINDTSNMFKDSFTSFGFGPVYLFVNKYKEYAHLLAAFLINYWDEEHAPYAIDLFTEFIQEFPIKQRLKIFCYTDNTEVRNFFFSKDEILLYLKEEHNYEDFKKCLTNRFDDYLYLPHGDDEIDIVEDFFTTLITHKHEELYDFVDDEIDVDELFINDTLASEAKKLQDEILDKKGLSSLVQINEKPEVSPEDWHEFIVGVLGEEAWDYITAKNKEYDLSQVQKIDIVKESKAYNIGKKINYYVDELYGLENSLHELVPKAFRGGISFTSQFSDILFRLNGDLSEEYYEEILKFYKKEAFEKRYTSFDKRLEQALYSLEDPTINALEKFYTFFREYKLKLTEELSSVFLAFLLSKDISEDEKEYIFDYFKDYKPKMKKRFRRVKDDFFTLYFLQKKTNQRYELIYECFEKFPEDVMEELEDFFYSYDEEELEEELEQSLGADVALIYLISQRVEDDENIDDLASKIKENSNIIKYLKPSCKASVATLLGDRSFLEDELKRVILEFIENNSEYEESILYNIKDEVYEYLIGTSDSLDFVSSSYIYFEDSYGEYNMCNAIWDMSASMQERYFKTFPNVEVFTSITGKENEVIALAKKYDLNLQLLANHLLENAYYDALELICHEVDMIKLIKEAPSYERADILSDFKDSRVLEEFAIAYKNR